MTHQLWQLLLLTQNPDSDFHLNCEECFALLEYDAELLAAGVAPEDIRRAVSRHLAICSACKTEFNDWQEKLRWLQSLQNDPEEQNNTKEYGHSK
jgi:predicted anti-sigma-YlaC factor YlaD